MFDLPVSKELAALGGTPVYRTGVVTDNGNDIIDVHDLKIENAVDLEKRINNIVGVVTVGLFAKRGADVLLLGAPDGVQTIEPTH